MFEQLKSILLESKEGKIKLNQKASIFLFCFLLSTFFWFLSALSKDYKTELSFHLAYTGFSESFILVEDPLNKIRGRVEGSGYELLGEQFALNNSKIPVDLSFARAAKGEDLYFLETKNIRPKVLEELDRDIQLINLYPDTLFFKTQARVAKEVDLVADFNLSFASGFRQRGEIKLTPARIKISGPLGYIDTVKSVKLKAMELKDLEDTTSIELEVALPKEIKGLKTATEKVKVEIPVEKYTEKHLDVNLEIKKEQSDWKIKTFPESVSLTILVPISKYEALSAELIRAKVYFKPELHEGADKLKVEVSGLPPYAELVRVNPDRVEYILRK